MVKKTSAKRPAGGYGAKRGRPDLDVTVRITGALRRDLERLEERVKVVEARMEAKVGVDKERQAEGQEAAGLPQ